MNGPQTGMLVVGLLLFGFADEVGPGVSGRLDDESAPAELDETLNAVVEEYCVRCHNERRLRGDMSLESFDVGAPEADAHLAEKIIHKLRAGMMPPADVRRPPEDTLSLLAGHLEDRLDEVWRRNPNPGNRTFQRLNRAEYEASIRDLFGLKIDASAYLPTETVSDNFDNISDTQILSATLLESYMRAAAQVSRDAVGDASAAPATTAYKIPKTVSQVGHVEGTPMGTRGGIAVTHNFPADGEYVFELDLHGSPDGQLFGLTSSVQQMEIALNGERVALLEIDRFMTESDPTGLRVETPPIHVRAGPQHVSAAFLLDREGPVTDLITPLDFTLADPNMGVGYGVTTIPHLRDLSISGPFSVTGISDTPARRRIFSCRPTSHAEEGPCAEEIIASLAEQAFRRPLDGTEVPELMGLFEEGRAEGGFEIGIRNALWAILSSPRFIFRLEETPDRVKPGETYELDDVDLASRLSFFLWATPPDEELVRLAREGRLSNDGELERQTRRMLADPRAESLSTRFASQWLRLQDLEKINPDAQLYPYFDFQLKEAMDRETEMLFGHIVQEDRSVLELLTADYTFVNERLARHYGIPDVTGSAFRRVNLQDDNRRGLLGHGSILMMTSHGNRTSPVLRGKWVMEVLLGSPPPPPPPAVPTLDETVGSEGSRQLTTRERMESHRANPACMSCHRVIDPIGLALDNFDVTGAWRIKENMTAIDPSGELYDGTPIDGPAGLRNTILKRPSVFRRTLAKNLMAYALGRRVEYYDMPTIRLMEREAAENGDRMSYYILGVVQSPAFRMSRAVAGTAAGALN
ncbi:MAG: DUF1592 domain-containing protein [Gemmatimonadetes bacterium]|nr:DUF1592 domain-containing protein [Gemmatimonadota bacterium]MDA1104843.1 DUF1592 domain-containing protein [Gemmatimonadota bacterium]